MIPMDAAVKGNPYSPQTPADGLQYICGTLIQRRHMKSTPAVSLTAYTSRSSPPRSGVVPRSFCQFPVFEIVPVKYEGQLLVFPLSQYRWHHFTVKALFLGPLPATTELDLLIEVNFRLGTVAVNDVAKVGSLKVTV